MPGSVLDITGETGSDPRSYRVDFGAIRAALPGYDATWSIADGAARARRGATARPRLTRADFDGDFVRLAVLQRKQEAGLLDAGFRPR